MDLILAVRDEVLARFVQYAPHAVMTGIAHALDLPEPAFYDDDDDDDGQPIADEFVAYITALSAAVEARRITFVHLLRAAVVAAPAPLATTRSNSYDSVRQRLGWIHHDSFSHPKGSFQASLQNLDRDARIYVVDIVRWFPKRSYDVGTGGLYARVTYADIRRQPATAKLVPPDHLGGTIEWLALPLAMRYRRTSVAALYDALAKVSLDWAPLARWMQLVPTRTGAPYTLVAPGHTWSAEQVRSLLLLAERQGVTAYQLFDACKAAGHLHLADLVVWHLTHHPAAYALVHGIERQTAASAQNSAAEISARLVSAEAVGLEDSESVAVVVEPMPEIFSRSAAETMMAQLPMEVLVAVLCQLWALEDLIVCRRVCRRWRAAVVILATRDRRFAYHCGVRDWCSLHNLPGIPEPALPITEMAMFFLPRPAIVDMWCTCGRLLPSDVAAVMFDSVADVQLAYPPYADRHGDQRRPLARWAQLRPSRDLALALAQACARIDPRVLEGNFNFQQAPWLPLFLWLPEAVVRPRNTTELLALVRTLVDDVQDNDLALAALWTRLSDPANARAWYSQYSTTAAPSQHSPTWEATWLQARPPATMSPSERARALQVRLDGDYYDPTYQEAFVHRYPDYAVRDTRHLQLQDDCGGWQKRRWLARLTALRWADAVECGCCPFSRRRALGTDLNTATANDIALNLFDKVHVVDAVASLFDERCVLSCTYAPESDGDYKENTHNFYGGLPATYFIGLDARGHLVGAVTGTIVPI